MKSSKFNKKLNILYTDFLVVICIIIYLLLYLCTCTVHVQYFVFDPRPVQYTVVDRQ